MLVQCRVRGKEQILYSAGSQLLSWSISGVVQKLIGSSFNFYISIPKLYGQSKIIVLKETGEQINNFLLTRKGVILT